MDDEMLTYMIAVSESTPGSLMVNIATYVGASQAGVSVQRWQPLQLYFRHFSSYWQLPRFFQG